MVTYQNTTWTFEADVDQPVKLQLKWRGRRLDGESLWKRVLLLVRQNSCETSGNSTQWSPLAAPSSNGFLPAASGEIEPIAALHQPYSFVLSLHEQWTLAGRDKWGRYGLLYQCDSDDLCFSHFPKSPDFTDLTVEGFTFWGRASESPILLPRTKHLQQAPTDTVSMTHVPELAIAIARIIDEADQQLYRLVGGDSMEESPVTALSNILKAAVLRPWTIVSESGLRLGPAVPARVGLCFSGGLDSSLVARTLLESEGIEEIYLINVSFLGVSSPDYLTCLISYNNLLRCRADLGPQAPEINLILSFVTQKDLNEHFQAIKDAVEPESTMMDFNIASPFYFAGRMSGRLVRTRQDALGLLNCSSIEELDELCQKLTSLPHIFAKPMVKTSVKAERKTCALCSNYVARANCIREACRYCCQKRLSEGLCSAHGINESYRDAQNVEETLHETMGDAWERMRETLPEMQLPTGTPLFCGNGADELFGGYGRFKTARLHGGDLAARKQMIADLERLWKRNLGRDDRVMLAAGVKLVIHPYLDDGVTKFVESLDATTLLDGDAGYPRFAGEKAFLRQVAAHQGLGWTARLRKRAIQFGSRSSHVLFCGEGKPSRRSMKGTTPLEMATKLLDEIV